MALRPSLFVFFNSQGQGWSERYWKTSNLPLIDVATSGILLLFARTKMLCTGVKLVWAYVSYDDEFRDVFPIDPLPQPNAAGIWNPALGPIPAQPNESLVARLYSGDRAGKYTYISGVPNTDTTFAGQYPPTVTNEFQEAFNDWLNVLKTEGWGWKGLTYSPLLAPSTTVSLLVQGDDEWTATVASSAAFVKGGRAKLYDGTFAGPPNVRGNRVYEVVDIIDATHMTLGWRGADLGGLTYIGGAKLQPQIKTILPITGGKIYKLSTRKRGVGGLRAHGRRKAR